MSREAPERSFAQPVLLVIAAQIAYGIAFLASSSLRVDGVRHFLLFDDAMISMSYARTFAEGHGLVWFAGAPRVQGFTNPLWTLLMAAVHWLPVPPRFTSLVMQIFGIALIPLTGLCAARIHAQLAPSSRHPWLVPLLVGFHFPLYLWSGLGSEAGLIALLLCVTTLSVLTSLESGRIGRAAFVAMILGVLTRLDFAVFALVGVAFLFRAARGDPQQQRRAWLGTLSLLASLAVLLGLQAAYYGDLLPNTFYLKLGVPLATRLARGAGSAHRFLADLSYLAVAVSVFVFARARIPANAKALVLSLIASGLLYGVYVGGDAWEWGANVNRFQLPLVPLWMVLFALAVEQCVTWTRQRGRAAAMVALSLALLLLVRTNAGTPFEPERALLRLNETALRVPPFSRETHDLNALEAGLLLRDAARRPLTIAVWSAGITPYVIGEGRFIDLLGRSDRRIARQAPLDVPFLPGHVKWDLAYSIGELDPDVCVGSLEPPASFKNHFREPIDVIQARWPIYVKRRVLKRDFVPRPELDALQRRYSPKRAALPRSAR